jgi:protein AaeX
MIKEVDLFGIYLPPMFVYAMAAGLIWLALRQCLAWAGAYRLVWHPALFNTALYVLILSLCVTIVFR